MNSHDHAQRAPVNTGYPAFLFTLYVVIIVSAHTFNGRADKLLGRQGEKSGRVIVRSSRQGEHGPGAYRYASTEL